VAKGLWDSWEEDASPSISSPAGSSMKLKMHVLDHKGRFSPSGPLNVGRLPRCIPLSCRPAPRSRDASWLRLRRHRDAVHPSRRCSGLLRRPQAATAEIRTSTDDLRSCPVAPCVARRPQRARASTTSSGTARSGWSGWTAQPDIWRSVRYPLDGRVPIDELGPAEIRSISAQLLNA